MALALAAAPSAWAQESRGEKVEGVETGFARTAIPEDVEAALCCVQAGGETLVDLAEVMSIVPDRIRGVMTFSVATRDGRTHVIYLGETTDCVLQVQRRQ